MLDLFLIALCRACYFWLALVRPIIGCWGYNSYGADGNPLPGFYHWYERSMQNVLRSVLAAGPSALAQFVQDYWYATRSWDDYVRLAKLAMHRALKRSSARNLK